MDIDTTNLGHDFVASLLAHFDDRQRDMPWRRTRDPYAIWISEVMLQQTRVDVVIPYFERWMARFPTVDDLAAAESQHVLKSWEGLGYYSRARNLHAAARALREKYDSNLPDSADALRLLPGIGAYTAGAVSSIAFGRAEPAVDGNARRVFARLLDLEHDSIPGIQRIVRQVLPPDRPGDFNQAIMELGATICTLRPMCDICPVRSHCRALKNDTVALRPAVKPRRPAPTHDLAVVVALRTDDASVLLSQRPETGLLAGMWEFPARPCTPRSATSNARALLLHAAGTITSHRILQAVTHQFSHRTETYHPRRFVLTGSMVHQPPAPMTWVPLTELDALPLPAAQRRIARNAGLSQSDVHDGGPA